MQSHGMNPRSLFKSLLFERWRWRALILSVSLLAACLGILAPYAQKHFADDLLGGHPAQLWIWAAFLLTLGAQSLAQLSMWLAIRESMITQKALGDLTFARLLEGPGGLIGARPAGEAVSLFAVDVPGAAALLDQALVMISAMIFPIILAPIALHYFFGIPAWASLGAIFTLGLVNLGLALRQSKFFVSFKQLAAERTGLVAEWVQNIRTLRILGWVGAAEERIFALRRRESRNRKRMVTNGQIMNALASSVTFGLNILAILLLLHLRGGAAAGARPTPGELLSLFWILGVFLARPLRQFPWAFVITMDSLTSIRRLQEAMDYTVTLPTVHEQVEGVLGLPAEPAYALEVRGLTLEAGGKQLLSEMDLCVKPGELVAIVGEVGSGKSLLFKSLMGATGASFARFAVGGRRTAGPRNPAVRALMAFVPQEGFTMSATLRENVTFNYHDSTAPDPGRDRRVLRSLELSQFVPERERVSEGVDAEIGERGVNLSGGQRQRIGLARAHFADRPIILMDDCLSAVDVDTEARLVEKLICGEWRERTRILVTHRMAVLPRCDRVIFLDSGRILLSGTYSELVARSRRFREFVRREAVRVEETEKKSETQPVEVPRDG